MRVLPGMILPLLCSLKPRWLTLAFAAVWMGCANSHDPASNADRVHGVISIPILSSLSVIAPSPVKVGVPVDIVIRTFGSSTCELPAGMDVSKTGSDYLFTPWVTSSVGKTCTDDLRSYSHPASVTFSQAGTARVIAYGYKFNFDGTKSLGTVGVDITVQP